MRVGFAATLLLLVPLSAAAQDSGFGYRFEPGPDSDFPAFAGLRGSLAFATSVRTTVPTTPPTSLRASFNTGGGASVYIGMRLPYGFKAELEGLYRNQKLGSVAVNNVSASASGYGQMAAPMLNLYWDVPVSDFPVRPFIGAGIGYGWTETSLHSVGGVSTGAYLHSDNWRLTYDAMAGLEVPLSASSRVTAMYRWLGQNSAYKCGTAGAGTSKCPADFNESSIDLGLEMDMP
jgi:opacity protein-like surface antigen